MRRKEREITSIDEKLAIIEKCKVCRLGLSANNSPYIVPVNFGFTYESNRLTLFFHGAGEGRKMDIIRENNNACFEMDCDGKLIENETAANFSYAYKSIIGFGKISILETDAEKTEALNILMKHQTGSNKKYSYTADELSGVCVYKLSVDDFTGKKNPAGDW